MKDYKIGDIVTQNATFYKYWSASKFNKKIIKIVIKWEDIFYI